MKSNDIHAVILAGGSGTRFWPLSRHQRPKQLIPLLGGQTTLAATVERLASLVPGPQIMVITNRDHQSQVRELLVPPLDSSRIIAEPVGRNTAPAIALGAQLLATEQGPATTMIVLPADHYIGEVPAFLRTLELACRVADEGYLVTLGMTPSRPETGYGYIQGGKAMAGSWPAGQTVCKVDRFVEKPDVHKALQYLQAGNYYWNSGIFIWRVEAILAELAAHLPGVSRCLEDFCRDRENLGLDQALLNYFATVESISIDYGVLEKSSKVAVIPGSFAWSDLGSWDALDELHLRPREAAAKTITIDSRNNSVFAAKPTALIDVENLLVVDTDDALLICKKGSSQKVRNVVEQLRQAGNKELL
ncbi:MAG: NTP transferase domain-containing protein [Deltaproteobacteria bacterium]|nr:NTP transferase domain-containing protein [Candidatus Anaeroferrophillus wilburensis]MBN2888825.1 NTP transferase domain-containing protein [Deltaproteobacteria bacterium]